MSSMSGYWHHKKSTCFFSFYIWFQKTKKHWTSLVSLIQCFYSDLFYQLFLLFVCAFCFVENAILLLLFWVASFLNDDESENQKAQDNIHTTRNREEKLHQNKVWASSSDHVLHINTTCYDVTDEITWIRLQIMSNTSTLHVMRLQMKSFGSDYRSCLTHQHYMFWGYWWNHLDQIIDHV